MDPLYFSLKAHHKTHSVISSLAHGVIMSASPERTQALSSRQKSTPASLQSQRDNGFGLMPEFQEQTADSRNRSGQTPFVLPEIVAGVINSWSGSIVSIPTGWALCDGTNGTPDLRDRFIVGAGSTYSVDDMGGSETKDHTFTDSGHTHPWSAGAGIVPGAFREAATNSNSATGTTDLTDDRPPFYHLAWIMKL